jgi:hypothetical protein
MPIALHSSFHASDAMFAVLSVLIFIALCSLLQEPSRRNFNAILVGGAGAAYLSGGGLGLWELAFTAVMAFCAYRGLRSYRFIGLAWILHTLWDLVHHFNGHPIIPFIPNSSEGCAITDTLLAIWFFVGAPAVFTWRRESPNRTGSPTAYSS